MKNLLLIRHAKAVHDNAYKDFERPLTDRGIKDAQFMAEKLLEEKIVPRILVTSPALRTLSTADIFAEFLSLSRPKEDVSIYEASRITLLGVINGFDDEYDFIGLVGHNPTVEGLSEYLTKIPLGFPTCGVALIEFPVDNWKMVSGGTGTLKWHASPKD
ncbi:MAG TPA: histidine phosphatase family protein [Mucilaginibacter sp.]|jgi:phosphohistidine phosphatase|nr:histidine phosphatase family protein [Mucilaginibacter sp.]